MNGIPEYLIQTREFSTGIPSEYLGKRRSDVKLLSINTSSGTYSTGSFGDIAGLLQKDDLLVFNDSRMVRSSLKGYARNHEQYVRVNFGYCEDGVIAEIRDRLHEYHSGDAIMFADGSFVTLEQKYERYGRYWHVSISDSRSFNRLLKESGDFIIYGKNSPSYPESVYYSELATVEGSVEYPCALRPFTGDVIELLRKRGIQLAPLTIHCNLGSLDASEFFHQKSLLPEFYYLPDRTAEMISKARDNGGRIIAIGTGAARALTTVHRSNTFRPGKGFTSIFIDQKTETGLDGIVTGMHDPTTSHILLLSAFADIALIRSSYEASSDHGFRWHEFGDISIILGPRR
ncbi:MAG: S-adenosylmethionine:tRNA ribosyltransferase-isomerase [Candidatus Thermoplasmatota archaeon]|nr:S-adenosylmethionine:tRNA ribosyltransferase-isomerase [Candidatus Thermoplasmatota archaeon]